MPVRAQSTLGATRLHARRATCCGDVRAGLRLGIQIGSRLFNWAAIGIHARRLRRGGTDVRAEASADCLITDPARGIHARPHQRGGADVRAAASFPTMRVTQMVPQVRLGPMALRRSARVVAGATLTFLTSAASGPSACAIAIGDALTRAKGHPTTFNFNQVLHSSSRMYMQVPIATVRVRVTEGRFPPPSRQATSPLSSSVREGGRAIVGYAATLGARAPRGNTNST